MDTSVLIIEDQQLLRAGVKTLLADLDAAILVLEANSVGESLGLLDRHQEIALVILDLRLPDSPVDESCREIRSARPGLMAGPRDIRRRRPPGRRSSSPWAGPAGNRG